MTHDEREVPLDPFETDMLAELLAARADLDTTTADSNIAPMVPHRRRRHVFIAAAGVAAAGLVAVATTLVTEQSNPASATPALPRPLAFAPGTRAAAVALLDRAAHLQDTAPRPVGPVLYAKTQNYAMSTDISHRRSTTVVSTTVREVWEATDGAARVTEYAQDTWPAGGDVGGPKPVGGINHTGVYKPGGWADTNAGLPTTTQNALRVLKNQVAKQISSFTASPSAGVYNFAIGDRVKADLEGGTASPGQVAANYELLATAPGVFYAGQVTDNSGRTGEAVGVQVSYQDPLSTGIQYFVIEPATGAILEVELVDTPAPPALHLPPGPTVQEYSVILDSGRVSALGASPTLPGHS